MSFKPLRLSLGTLFMSVSEKSQEMLPLSHTTPSPPVPEPYRVSLLPSLLFPPTLHLFLNTLVSPFGSILPHYRESRWSPFCLDDAPLFRLERVLFHFIIRKIMSVSKRTNFFMSSS